MSIFESLRFGARVLGLKALASRPREEIERRQYRRLQKLVRHAKENSAYLSQKYAHIDVDNLRLRDLPTCDKSEMMEHFDDWLTVDDVDPREVEEFFKDSSNIGKYYKDKYVVSHTSGSEGQSLLLVKDASDFELMFALQASRGHSHSLDVREVVQRFTNPVRLAAVTLQPGFYPSGSAFAYMPESVKRYVEVLPLCLNDENLIERLQEFRPTHLTTYASILHELARQVEAGRLDLKPELQQIMNISEKLMPEPRKQYAELFDAPVLDDYGMGECLFLSNGCLTSGGMHVNADWVIVEVVDENNRPVPAGEPGAKILLTNLANKVQPFVRYEVGDMVVLATEPCDCGINLPLIASIDGRTSTIFYADVGGELRPFHPAVIEQAIGSLSYIREYQLEQETPNHVHVRVEPIDDCEIDAKEVEQTILSHLADHHLNGHINVDIEVVDRLVPEEDDGKFKRVVTRVEPTAVS